MREEDVCMSNNYYAVKHGRKIGIFETWNECNEQVYGFKGAMYKKFDTKKGAEDYLNTQEAILSERHESEEDVFNSLCDNEMIAYVDGSNLSDGSKYSWGVVLFHKVMKEKPNYNVRSTSKVELYRASTDKRFIKYRNVAGELFAAMSAIDYAIENKAEKITIYHDYSGIRHWALKEWKSKNELSNAYVKFVSERQDKLKIEFVKVDGHTGDVFNERADELAKFAIEKS